METEQIEYQLQRNGRVIHLSDRELKLIAICQTSASDTPGGLHGPSLTLLVDKLAGALDIDGRNAQVPGPDRLEFSIVTLPADRDAVRKRAMEMGLSSTIAPIAPQGDGGWIAASDRLPKKHEPVVGFDCFYGRVGEAVLSTWSGHLEFINSDDCYITHWQPFPYPTEDMATCPEDEEE